jgi:hypothetical protein
LWQAVTVKITDTCPQEFSWTMRRHQAVLQIPHSGYKILFFNIQSLRHKRQTMNRIARRRAWPFYGCHFIVKKSDTPQNLMRVLN